MGSQAGILTQMRKRLAHRLNEMTDRRRRLIKYNYKKEDKAQLFESQYPDIIRRKEHVIRKFSSVQLEELLNNSTKNVAQEVVTCLIPRLGEGVLVQLESITAQAPKKRLMPKNYRSMNEVDSSSGQNKA
jgi:Mg/Co/Ni transporter MgtE